VDSLKKPLQQIELADIGADDRVAVAIANANTDRAVIDKILVD